MMQYKMSMKKSLILLVLIFSSLPSPAAFIISNLGLAANGWKAGVARVVITPRQPLWMAGFAVRTHPSVGTRLDLWAKALALEDAGGNRAVLVTADLLGLPKEVSDNIREQLQAKYKLARAQVL